MKHSTKIYALITFLFITNNVNAYRWIMSNWTSKTLLVQVELLGSTNPYFVLVRPGESADFDWTAPNPMAGFCLGAIKWVLPDNAMLRNREIIHNRHQVIDNGKMLEFLYKHSEKYPRHTAELKYLTDRVYKQTVKEAKRLVGPLKDVVDWFSEKISHSPCRSRDISIIEKESGKIYFYTLAN